MADHLVRGLGPGGSYRFVATICSASAREACERHGVLGLPAIALGRAVGAGLCLATLTKGGERVTVQWNGDGPLVGLVVDARDDGDVRAYVRAEPDERRGDPPDPAEPRPSTAPVVGSRGRVTVIRDLGLRESYIGQGELVNGEIDRDVERYLTASEQVDSALFCDASTDDDGAIGYAVAVLVQAMPMDGQEGIGDVIAEVRRRMADGDVTRLLRGAAEGIDAGMLAAAVVPEGVAEVLSETPVRFHCGCDRERVAVALSSLGPTDLKALAEERGGAEVTCHFCAEVHRWDEAEVHALAGELLRTLN